MQRAPRIHDSTRPALGPIQLGVGRLQGVPQMPCPRWFGPRGNRDLATPRAIRRAAERAAGRKGGAAR